MRWRQYLGHARHRMKFKSLIHCTKSYKFFNVVDGNAVEMESEPKWIKRRLSVIYPVKEGMKTHSGILTWEIPWREQSGGLQSMGLQKFGHNWTSEHDDESNLWSHSKCWCGTSFDLDMESWKSRWWNSATTRAIYKMPTCLNFVFSGCTGNDFLSIYGLAGKKISSSMSITWKTPIHCWLIRSWLSSGLFSTSIRQ